jgi:hypothetical protein
LVIEHVNLIRKLTSGVSKYLLDYASNVGEVQSIGLGLYFRRLSLAYQTPLI